MMLLWLLLSHALAAPPTLDAALLEARQASPEAWAVVTHATPRASRAGFPVFSDAALADDAVLPLIAARLVDGKDPSPIRAALATVLGRHAPGAWLTALLDAEGDPAVRVVLVGALRRAPDEVALPALRAALADPDPSVRDEAAFALAHRPDGKPAQ